MAVAESEIIFTEPGKGVFLDTLIPGINVACWDEEHHEVTNSQVTTRSYCEPQAIVQVATATHKTLLGLTQRVARITNDKQRSNNWNLEWVLPEHLIVGDAVVSIKMREHKPSLDRVVAVTSQKQVAKTWELTVTNHGSFFSQGLLVSNQRNEETEHATERTE